jgi:hypothetical protein
MALETPGQTINPLLKGGHGHRLLLGQVVDFVSLPLHPIQMQSHLWRQGRRLNF